MQPPPCFTMGYGVFLVKFSVVASNLLFVPSGQIILSHKALEGLKQKIMLFFFILKGNAFVLVLHF